MSVVSVASAMSVVSVMKDLYLITQSLNEINISNQNTSFGAMGVMSVVSVMSVVCVMRGLYLITQSTKTVRFVL